MRAVLASGKPRLAKSGRGRDMASDSGEIPIIALLFCDCTGIGPEIAAKVLAERTLADRARLVAVGDARVLEKGMRDAKLAFPWHRVERVSDIDWDDPSTPLIDLKNIDPSDVGQGAVSP